MIQGLDTYQAAKAVLRTIQSNVRYSVYKEFIPSDKTYKRFLFIAREKDVFSRWSAN